MTTDKYPNLAQMGVKNPQEITGYTLSHIVPATDVLKINTSARKVHSCPSPVVTTLAVQYKRA